MAACSVSCSCTTTLWTKVALSPTNCLGGKDVVRRTPWPGEVPLPGEGSCSCAAAEVVAVGATAGGDACRLATLADAGLLLRLLLPPPLTLPRSRSRSRLGGPPSLSRLRLRLPLRARLRLRLRLLRSPCGVGCNSGGVPPPPAAAAPPPVPPLPTCFVFFARCFLRCAWYMWPCTPCTLVNRRPHSGQGTVGCPRARTHTRAVNGRRGRGHASQRLAHTDTGCSGARGGAYHGGRRRRRVRCVLPGRRCCSFRGLGPLQRHARSGRHPKAVTRKVLLRWADGRRHVRRDGVRPAGHGGDADHRTLGRRGRGRRHHLAVHATVCTGTVPGHIWLGFSGRVGRHRVPTAARQGHHRRRRPHFGTHSRAVRRPPSHGHAHLLAKILAHLGGGSASPVLPHGRGRAVRSNGHE